MPDIDPKRLQQGIDALGASGRAARPLVMKWAVATVSIQDVIREQKAIEATWPEIGAIAGRYLEDMGRATGQWKTQEEAALRITGGDIRTSSAPPKAPTEGWFDRVDRYLTLKMQRYGFFLLRISLGIVFIWFGALKPFGLSPADDLVTKTVTWIPPRFFIPFLGVWEVAIGVGLLYRPLLRVALFLLALQMPGTALPLFLLRDVCFTHFPYALTLEGQYIIKNLTLVSAAIVVGGTVRHGRTRSMQERVTWWL